MSGNKLSELLGEYNAKYYGFKTIRDFYDASSIDSKIQNIKIPTIFLNAIDDCFCPSKGIYVCLKFSFYTIVSSNKKITHRKAIPYGKLASNPNTALVLTKIGIYNIQNYIL